MTPFVRLDGVSKRFDGAVAADGITLVVERGEVMALLGPSGSGKTTLLRLLAGFEQPDAGRMIIDGADVGGVSPARRRCGMVFQHYALFPHLDVGENVAFGLRERGRQGGRVAVERQVAAVLALVDLAGFERRRVQELSGGQQQRVALARALAPEPRVLLLDEPLSNLDPALRERTRRELRQLIKRVGITTLFVTHEQEEAFDLGDRVAVLAAGRLDQVGTPDDLYERPASLFVATFVGRANVFRGAAAHALGGADGQIVVVRPEAFRFSEIGIPGVVKERRYTGAAAFYLVDGDRGERFEVLAAPGAARVGDRVFLETAQVLLFPEERERARRRAAASAAHCRAPCSRCCSPGSCSTRLWSSWWRRGAGTPSRRSCRAAASGMARGRGRGSPPPAWGPPPPSAGPSRSPSSGSRFPAPPRP